MKKKFDFETMYKLCNKHQFFTSGDNTQYSKMFDLCKVGISQEALVILPYVCSTQSCTEIEKVVGEELFGN